MRPALAAGAKVVFEPGRPSTCSPPDRGRCASFAVTAGLVDGALDEPGARERALELARERGYLGA